MSSFILTHFVFEFWLTTNNRDYMIYWLVDGYQINSIQGFFYHKNGHIKKKKFSSRVLNKSSEILGHNIAKKLDVLSLSQFYQKLKQTSKFAWLILFIVTLCHDTFVFLSKYTYLENIYLISKRIRIIESRIFIRRGELKLSLSFLIKNVHSSHQLR